jgi:diamine N-acetyltransferase
MIVQASKETAGGCEFHRADSGNCETLVELMREFNAFEDLPFDETKARKALKQILRDESFGRVWLIKRGEETAGYAVLTLGFSLEFHGRDAFIDEIYLREEFRGKGFGKQAVQFLEEQCRDLGVKALHLEVERKNGRAQIFYHRNGFTDHARFLMTKLIEQEAE